MVDVAGSAGSWAEEPIRKNRTSDATVTITRGGSPLASRPVTVAQKSHAFLFGSTGFQFLPSGLESGGLRLTNISADQSEARQKLARLEEEWFTLFNFVTLPFYWGNFEPVRGKPDTARLLAGARWFHDRGIPIKGHPLRWHTVQPDWLLDLSTDQVRVEEEKRIRREVGDFKDLIQTWDAINEAVIMPVFDRKDNGITRLCRAQGRIATIRMAFETAREADPNCFLLLNDFDMSTAFECLIEGVLAAGIKVDAIGLQSHMHQGYWGEERTLDVLARFSRYGLPIHFTESTIMSGHLMPPEYLDLNDYQVTEWPTTEVGEARQAEEVVRHYKTLLSHPAVKAMTYWDIADDGWLHAPSGLVRADYSPKPSYEAMKSLIKGAWWLPPTEMVTDEAGRIRFSGWLGDYEVTADGAKAGFSLGETGAASVEVSL
jgi:GH35 family endo-1,4-beta-xylanase